MVAAQAKCFSSVCDHFPALLQTPVLPILPILPDSTLVQVLQVPTPNFLWVLSTESLAILLAVVPEWPPRKAHLWTWRKLIPRF